MRFGEADVGVNVTIKKGVADVRLDRPSKHNAINPILIAAISETLSYLADQDGVRCVLLRGEGRSFCSGIDITMFGGGGIGSLSPRTHGIANRAQHCAWGWRELPMPVIAVLHGYVFGAGVQIALGADIRIAAPDTRLSVMEAKHGLVPDMGGFALARGIVREDQWRELVLTAKEVTAEQGQALGLITRIAQDPLAEALTLAHDIASKSPLAIRAVKRISNSLAEASAAELMQAESDEQDVLVAALAHNRTD